MLFRSLSFAILMTATAVAQTTTAPPKKSVAHRAPSAAAEPIQSATSTATANSADTPPNVPPVEGTPQNLYSLRYIDIQVGAGELAKPRQYYTVHYTGWLTDGTKFDSSHDHPGGEPIVFPYGARQVIAGWDTGFEGMHIGGKRRLFIPYQLAYGEVGRSPVIPPKADLIFDVELVSQSDTPPEPKEPPSRSTPTNPVKPDGAPEPDTQHPVTPPPAGSATEQPHS
jgi:peptidylprolyl isomerase